MSDRFTIRRGDLRDAETLAALGVQVFLDTYATEGVRADLAREAHATYSPEAFARRLGARDREFVLAVSGDAVRGFAELRLGQVVSPVAGWTGAELVRLYVQPRHQGLGLGECLMREAERIAGRHGCIWLTAWDGNRRAAQFYATRGFNIVGETVYQFEDRIYRNDVYAKLLPP